MASGPTWNRQRGCWYVQYFDGDSWRRKTVADGPDHWKPGDPDPPLRSAPPEAFAARVHWDKVEAKARELSDAGIDSALRAFLDDHLSRYAIASTRDSLRVSIDQFLDFCGRRGLTRIDQVDRAART